jgi:hypothetical protein
MGSFRVPQRRRRSHISLLRSPLFSVPLFSCHPRRGSAFLVVIPKGSAVAGCPILARPDRAGWGIVCESKRALVLESVGASIAPFKNKARHLDRSDGQPHCSSRSGETPVFRPCRCPFSPLPVLAVACSCRCWFLSLSSFREAGGPAAALAVVRSCRHPEPELAKGKDPGTARTPVPLEPFNPDIPAARMGTPTANRSCHPPQPHLSNTKQTQYAGNSILDTHVEHGHPCDKAGGR